jgi:hypothetical protein
LTIVDEGNPSFAGMGIEGTFKVRDGFQELSDIYLQKQGVSSEADCASVCSRFLWLDLGLSFREFLLTRPIFQNFRSKLQTAAKRCEYSNNFNEIRQNKNGRKL